MAAGEGAAFAAPALVGCSVSLNGFPPSVRATQPRHSSTEAVMANRLDTNQPVGILTSALGA